MVAALILVARGACAQRRQEQVADRTSPPGQTFHDGRSGVSFDVPAGWVLTRKDHEVSTFQLDARTAPRSARFKAVANIDFNPFPASTFSGAMFYFSVTPRASNASCAREATPAGRAVATEIPVGQLTFRHGHDEHFHVCVDARDEIYTTYRRGSCLRFDLTMNNFCGGEVSGVRPMSAHEIENVFERLQRILQTVRLDSR